MVKKAQLTGKWWPNASSNWDEATALGFLESYQICQIKRNHRNQRPHDTGCWSDQTTNVASVPAIAIIEAKDRLDGALLLRCLLPDNVEEIAKGIKAIIQPGGSIACQESIEAADKYSLTMVFTGVRHLDIKRRQGRKQFLPFCIKTWTNKIKANVCDTSKIIRKRGCKMKQLSVQEVVSTRLPREISARSRHWKVFVAPGNDGMILDGLEW